MIFDVGRICVKIAGRDAGRKCVILSTDKQLALIDGNVRRKKVNLKHLEPLTQTIEVKENASHDDVKKAFEKLGLSVWDHKARKATERPKRMKKKSVKEKKAPKVEEKVAELPKVESVEETEKPVVEAPKVEESPAQPEKPKVEEATPEPVQEAKEEPMAEVVEEKTSEESTN